jgi:superfamily II DNA or RNA helicase
MGHPLSLFREKPAPLTGRTLRWYQDACVTKTLAASGRRLLNVLPTGTGKTICIAELCRRMDQGRILILAENRRILRQAQDKVSAWLGGVPEDLGFEQAENKSHGERIVCGMRQTLANPMRLERYDERGTPGLIIVDEAHHFCGREGSQYQRIIGRYPDALVVGFTATPDRGDRAALGQAWKETPFTLEIHDAIADGYLVEPVPVKSSDFEPLDLSQVKVKGGELDDEAVEAMLATIVRQQAKEIVRTCESLKTIVFCGRVTTAHQLAKAVEFEMGRSCAVAIDGEMDEDERDRVLDGFEAGEHQFLVNVGICVEGFDAPDTAAVVLTRPYRARGSWVQRVGRGLRPLGSIGLDGLPDADARRAAIAASSKPNMKLVNFKFLPGRHTLVCPEDILGGKYSDEEKAKAKELREDGEAVTVSDALKKARDAIEAERRARAEAVRKAKAQAQIEWGSFDPFGALNLDMPDTGLFTTEAPKRASAAMKAWLRGQGLKVPESITKAQAQKLRGTIEVRKKVGLASMEQLQKLNAFGVTDAQKWTSAQAHAELTAREYAGRPAVVGQVKWLSVRGVNAEGWSYKKAAHAMREMQKGGTR